MLSKLSPLPGPVSHPTPAAALTEHAAEIRLLGKQTVENIVEIGRHLTEAKAEIKKLGGSWRDWLEAEFQWSDQQARRFMHIFERKSELNNLLNADLPVSALYYLAAPSTPTEARDEISARAQARKPLSVAEVKDVVDTAKGKQPSSKTGEAIGVKRKRRGSQEVRLEAFFNSILFVTTGCTAIAELEIPDLNKKQQDEAIAQLKEASAALSTFGNRFKNNNEKALDDVGPTNTNETERLQVRVKKLQAQVRQRDITIEGLRRDIAELQKTSGDMSISEFQTAIKKWEDTVEAQNNIIHDLQNENAKLRAGIAAPPPEDGLGIPDFLDRNKQTGAAAL